MEPTGQPGRPGKRATGETGQAGKLSQPGARAETKTTVDPPVQGSTPYQVAFANRANRELQVGFANRPKRANRASLARLGVG